MNSEQRIESELSGEWLQVSTEISGTNSVELLAAFYEPDRIRQWWGGELISDPLNDGTYTVHFAQLEQTMRGEVIRLVPGEVFVFSWVWDHEPELKDLMVTIRAVPTADGARLELEHGPYTEATRHEVEGHREGWGYFLPRLAEHLTRVELPKEEPKPKRATR